MQPCLLMLRGACGALGPDQAETDMPGVVMVELQLQLPVKRACFHRL
jgi:hypothetical protein